MALPKLDLPHFPITIPSTGVKTQIRPFTVKEEKILLIAKESNDRDQMIDAIIQIVNNCLVDVDSSSLSTFDLDYVLIQLRGKSVNNVIEFTIVDPDTEEQVDMEVDVDSIEIKNTDGHSKHVKLSDNFTLIMRYPTIKEVGRMGDDQGAFAVMISCIDSIVSGDEVYKFEDYSNEDIQEFVDDLTNEHVMAIKKFFETMPKLRLEKKYKTSAGDEKTFVVEGTESFFI